MELESEIIVNLFKSMSEESIVCAYHGDFNYEVVNGLLKTAKNNLSKTGIERGTAKKTYNVLVECLENIHKHASKVEKSNNQLFNEGIFILTNKDNGYSITVGNIIKKGDESQLIKNIEEVNNSSQEDLKQKYRAIITNGSISEKGGAGLGIVDIAIKSKSILKYSFHEYNKGLKFFTLSIDINTNKNNSK